MDAVDSKDIPERGVPQGVHGVLGATLNPAIASVDVHCNCCSNVISSVLLLAGDEDCQVLHGLVQEW